MKILVFGAPGSGQTTLASGVAQKLGIAHIDTDEYFWAPSPEPFSVRQSESTRNDLLSRRLADSESWVISGSIAGWAEFIRPQLDFVVYLKRPTDIRMERIRDRMLRKAGERILSGGDLEQQFNRFVGFAATYDTAGMDRQSLQSHTAWLEGLSCPYHIIDEPLTIVESATRVCEAIKELQVMPLGKLS